MFWKDLQSFVGVESILCVMSLRDKKKIFQLHFQHKIQQNVMNSSILAVPATGTREKWL